MTGELTVTPEFVWLLPAHTDKPKPIEAFVDLAVAIASCAAASPVAQTNRSVLCFIPGLEIMTAAGWTACGTPVEP